jgi:hypothetical protein
MTTRQGIIQWGHKNGWSVQGLDTRSMKFERDGVRINVLWSGRNDDTFTIAYRRTGGETTTITIATWDTLLAVLAAS